MLLLVRFITSLAISSWGFVVIALGLGQGMVLWIILGIVLTGVGLPLLASNPLATGWLYPSRAEEKSDPRSTA